MMWERNNYSAPTFIMVFGAKTHPLHCRYWCFLVCVCSQGAAAYPENEDQQQRLREAAEGLRVATNAAAQNAIKKKLINRLEVSDPNSSQIWERLLSARQDAWACACKGQQAAKETI